MGGGPAWLSRTRYEKLSQGFEDEAVVEGALAGLGVEVVYPEALTLAEQVRALTGVEPAGVEPAGRIVNRFRMGDPAAVVRGVLGLMQAACLNPGGLGGVGGGNAGELR